MLCPKFSESWFNRTHTVARRKLRPFCLWHYAYLELIDSPLSPGAKLGKDPVKITWADIEIATRICQLRYPQVLDVSITWWAKLRLFITMAKMTEDYALNSFYSYINDYFSPPRFNQWGGKDKGRQRGSPPDPLAVASAVIMMFGGGPQTEQFVWEMPIGQAFWYSSTLHYNRGAALDYMTARDEMIRNYLREKRRKGLI